MAPNPSGYAAFSHLPLWIDEALRELFRRHMQGQALNDEELRWELHLSLDQLDTLRSLRLVAPSGARPSALGLLQIDAAAPVVRHLERLVEIIQQRYRPGAPPIERDELLALLGLSDEEAQKIAPFATELELVDGPSWRLPLTVSRASHAKLADAIHDRYRDRYEAMGTRPPVLPGAAVLPVMVRRIHAERFRVLRSFDLDLGPGPTVLVGPNAAGKSTVLDLIAFVAHSLKDGVRKVVGEQGGLSRLRTRGTDGPVVLEVGFETDLAGGIRSGRYSFELDSVGSQVVSDAEHLEIAGLSGQPEVLVDGHRSIARLRRADGQQEERFHAADSLALPTIDDEQVFPMAVQLRNALASVVLVDRDPFIAAEEEDEWQPWGQRTGRTRRLLPLRQLFREVAGDDQVFVRLSEIVGTLVPGIERVERVVEAHGAKGIEVRLEVTEAGVPGTTSMQDLSAGTRQMLVLAALHVMPRPPRIILLEEPDAGLHVGALSALRDLLVSLAQRSTVVATTHSPSFVGLLDAERDVVALSREPGGTLSVSSLAAALRQRRWLDGFGTTAEAFVRGASERRR